jgi:hypothetical protein
MRLASPYVWVTWPVRSQHASRRNAHPALAVLRQRRREQQEADEFLALLGAEQSHSA